MIEINRRTLSNGLRLVHTRVPSTAMAAVTVLYDVGARDEKDIHTGLAHLMEHLMFAGSANVPDYSAALEQAGGQDNAWTSNDFTCFFDVVPAVNLATAFHIESDRMLSPVIATDTPEAQNALEVQRNVVVEEFKQQVLNQPYGKLAHALRAMLYKSSPYRWPVIGLEPAHVEKTSLDDVKQFFLSHYSPSNAILAVAGNVDFDEVSRLADQWFADIPARELTPRHIPQEVPVDEPRREEVYGPVPQPMVVLAWHTPAYGQPGYRECDIITDLLANGKASRMYRNLLMATDMFTDIDSSVSGAEHTGYLIVRGRLTSNTDDVIAAAEVAMLSQAKTLMDAAAIEARELERLGNRFESLATFKYMSVLDLSQALALAEYHGEDINTDIDRYRAVTADDIAATARDVFSRPPCVLIYRPEK